MGLGLYDQALLEVLHGGMAFRSEDLDLKAPIVLGLEKRWVKY